MAKDILYIANGAAVDAAWTGHIVISSDGNNWDAINKTGLSAGVHPVNINSNAANSYPGQIKENSFIVTIKRNDNSGPILKFNPAKVLNQSGWIVPGATSPAAGANQAITDILTWIVTV